MIGKYICYQVQYRLKKMDSSTNNNFKGRYWSYKKNHINEVKTGKGIYCFGTTGSISKLGYDPKSHRNSHVHSTDCFAESKLFW